MSLTEETLRYAYTTMKTIRLFEERVLKLFTDGHMPGFAHLYAGEEAMATGVCAHLRADDYVTSTHRGHGHCIAKGADVSGMMAELFGKATGLCKGKGGSMHIADTQIGILGANGIVGAGAPLACGAGLSAKTRGTDQVTVCFFGDGASEQGTLHESMNLACCWKLPVIFVCENNGFAESTPQSCHCSTNNIAGRAAAYGMPGVTADGTHFFAVYEAAGQAVARARAGEGPSLLEFFGFRYYGHFIGDPMVYVSQAQQAQNRTRDPIDKFKKLAVEQNLLPAEILDEIDAEVAQKIEKAVAFAQEGPMPDIKEVLTDVYVQYP